MVRSGCATAPAIPASITATGHGASYDGFAGAYTAVAGVTVTMLDRQTQASLASGITDANGAYSITAPTNGAPIDGILQFTFSSYYTTTYFFDAPWISNVQRDGQVISDGGANSIYGYADQTRDPTKGTLFVQVRDCNDQPVEHVTLDVVPAAGKIGYSDSSSAPSPVATETALPAGGAWAFNAEPGTVHMNLRVGGVIQFSQDVTVLVDQAATWAVGRVLP